MKSILKKVAGLALSAALVFGMISCSSEAENNAALIGILNSSKGNSGTPVKGTVATPAFSVASGAVVSGTSVTITCSTEGAKIYYTKDGTKPTAESTEYTSAISITEAVTVKAIAVKDGMKNSTVASASYTISSGNIPEGFVKVKGTTITGNESWIPSSEVFVSGRRITISDMYVCDHEVTRGEFKEVMGTDPSTASAYDKDGNELTGDAVLNNPVNYVNWYAAIAYCNKLSLKENLTSCYSVSGVTDWENLDYSSIPTSSNSTWDALTYDKEADGYRLPTEAEWEWLARGGENYTYAGSNTVDDVAWYKTNKNSKGSREVKTKQSNGYGLYDMSGNVREWCYDWFGLGISSSTADTGASSGYCRVTRGGAWYSFDYHCQVSRQNGFEPDRLNESCGFRVVRSSSKGNSGTPVMQTVAIPEFSIASGAVVSGTSVTITCSTEGAKIYYTTDGTKPTAESTEYTSAISVTSAVTLKAIALKSGMNDSAVASASYTISSVNIPVELVKVKGGTVTGKSNTNNYDGVFIEGRTVTLSDFYMSKYEVTKAQYKAIMEDTTLNTLGITADPSYSTLQPKTYVMAAGEEDYERPVENVTWYDAVYFCNLLSQKEGLEPVYTINNTETSTARISSAGASGNERVSIKYISSATVTADHTKNGYRLPTEAEWEYAARGGDPSKAVWDYTFSGADTAAGTRYNSSRNTGLDAVGWYCYNICNGGTTTSTKPTSGTAGYGTHQKGLKAPNALGIYDMSGNVWEWCYDWYSISVSTGEETNPLGSSSGPGRGLRGGSWYDGAYFASVCFRISNSPSYGFIIVGFRVVRSAN